MNTTDHMPAASWQDAVTDSSGARWQFWAAVALTLVAVFAQAVFA